MHQDLFSWGLPAGRVAGIGVRLHWLLLLYWFFELQDYLRLEGDIDRRLALILWLAEVGLSFGSILLHELGHAFVARAVGGAAYEIVLWPLGGLAFCQAPHRWRPQLAVAAGGPLVTLGIVAVSALVFWLGEGFFHSLSGGLRGLAFIAESVLVRWNLIILVFNLIPLYPMDGGRIFHACVWGVHEWRGVFGAYGRAVGLTLWASRVTALAGLSYSLWVSNIMLAAIFVWAWLGAEQLRR